MKFRNSLFALVMLVVSLSLVGCTRIGPGYVGIKVNNAGDNRGVDAYAAQTGWVFYNPLTSTVFEYPTFVQQVVLEGDEGITFSSESMRIGADISYSYSLDATKVPAFYVKFRNDDLNSFTHGYLRNLIRDKFNEEARKTTLEAITAGDTTFLTNVKAAVQHEVEAFGVNLEAQFGIVGAPRLPDQVIQSINAKVQANQIAQQKQAELAQTQADMAKERAKAETYATNRLVAAEAEAEANKKIAASITSELLELERLKKWNGELPQVNGGSTNPFISLQGK